MPATSAVDFSLSGDFPVRISTKLLQSRKENQFLRSAIEDICLPPKAGVLIVHGADGVGKTTIVAEALLSESAALPRHCGLAAVLWLNLLKRSTSPRFDEAAFYTHFIHLLQTAKVIAPTNTKKQTNNNIGCELVKKLLHEAGVKVLIVLDDISNPYPLQCIARVGESIRCIAICQSNLTKNIAACGLLNLKSIEIAALDDELVTKMLLQANAAKMHFDEAQIATLTPLCHGLPAIAELLSNQLVRLTTKHQVDIVFANLIYGVGLVDRQKTVVDLTRLLALLFSFISADIQSALYTFLLYAPGECVDFDDLVLLWKYNASDVADVRRRCQVLTASCFLTRTSATTFAVHSLFHSAILRHALRRRYLGARSPDQLRTRLIEQALLSDSFLILTIKRRRLTLLDILLRDVRNYALLAGRCLDVDDKTGQTPLFALIKRKWVENEATPSERNVAVEFFCRLGEITAVEQPGNCCSVLMEKDKIGKVSIYNLLRRSGRLRRQTTLIAAKEGSSHLLRMLVELRVLDLLAVDEATGNNTLMIAACKGYAGLVRYLIEADKLSINNRNKRGETVLLQTIRVLSTSTYQCYQVVKELLRTPHSAEIDLNLADNSGMTPLILAAGNGLAPILSLLLDDKALINVDQCDKNGSNALTVAILNGKMEIAGLLVENGATLNKAQIGKIKKSKEIDRLLAKIARIEQEKMSHPIFEALLSGDYECLVHLVDECPAKKQQHGGVVDLTNVRDKNNDTPLSLALLLGLQRQAMFLIRSGANFDDIDRNNNSALMLASATGLSNVVDFLLRLGASCNRLNKFGDSALIFAAKEGHDEIVNQLIRSGADLETRNQAGCTAFLLASSAGHLNVVETLLKFDVNYNIADNFGCSALIRACQNGHIKVVDLLFSLPSIGTMLEKPDNAGFTPLMAACSGGHVEIVQKLVKKSANLEAKNQLGNTPLLIASQHGHLPTVALLIGCGADLTAFNHNGDTALIEAASFGHSQVVEQLLRRPESSLLWVNRCGNTALHLAAWRGHLNVVEVLIRRTGGASLELANQFGYTALDAACLNGHVNVAAYLICCGAVYSDGVPANPCIHSPIHLAARKGHVDLANLLVQLDANLEQRDRFGNTPLILASTMGHLNVVKLLLKSMANINLVNNVGNSALTAACMYGHAAVAELLLESGANWKVKNSAGWTAVAIAESDDRLANVTAKIRRRRLSNNKSNNSNRQMIDNLYNFKQTSLHTISEQAMSPPKQFGTNINSNNSNISTFPLPDLLYAALCLYNATMNAR